MSGLSFGYPTLTNLITGHEGTNARFKEILSNQKEKGKKQSSAVLDGGGVLMPIVKARIPALIKFWFSIII